MRVVCGSWRWSVGLCLGLACLASAATAGTVYRWTDQNGVVHFADNPPARGPAVTPQQLPDTVVPISPPEPDVAADATPSAEGTPGGNGPARVVISEQEQASVGPGVQSFTGRVKNEGGAEASGVVVAITVVEPSGGAECVRDHIDVEPSTLAPGAEGTFEARFQNPCFKGPTNAELRAEWR
jgi:Domain of unknown function (DUF4124)